MNGAAQNNYQTMNNREAPNDTFLIRLFRSSPERNPKIVQ